jgi:hypothetical protein
VTLVCFGDLARGPRSPRSRLDALSDPTAAGPKDLRGSRAAGFYLANACLAQANLDRSEISPGRLEVALFDVDGDAILAAARVSDHVELVRAGPYER